MSAAPLSAAQRLQQAHEAKQQQQQQQAPLTEDPFPVLPDHHDDNARSFGASSTPSAAAAQTNGHRRKVDVSDQDAFPSLGGGGAPKAVASGWGTASTNKSIKSAPPVAAAPATTQSTGDAATLTLSLPTSSIHVGSPVPSSSSKNGGGLFSNDPRLKHGTPTTLGEVLRHVQTNSPENVAHQVEIQASSSSKLTTFIIKARSASKQRGGKSDASAQEVVERVKTELLAWLEKKVTDHVRVPKQLRAVIIGAKGRTLKQITDSTGCHIQIPRDDELAAQDDAAAAAEEQDEDPDVGPLISITLSGASSAVARAKDQISQIVRERTSKATTTLSGTDAVPSEYWIFLRHKVDDLVKRATDDDDSSSSSVSVYVPTRAQGGKRGGRGGVDVEDAAGYDHVAADAGDDKGGRGDDAVRVTGDKDAVKRVVEQIRAEVDELKQTVRPVIFSLPKRQHRFLATPAVADRILAETGCAVEVPHSDAESEDVVVRGPSRETIKAMQLVMDLAAATPVEQLDLLTAHRGTHDPRAYARSLSRYLLAKERLAKVARDTETKIYLPRPDEIGPHAATAYLEIVGDAAAPDRVATARGLVIAEVRKLPPTVFATVADVEPLVLRYVVSKRANKVKALEKEHSVEVVFPPTGAGRGEILVVYGGDDAAQLAPQALEATKTAIAALTAECADLVSVTVSIPTALHGTVIGTGGTTLNAVLGEDRSADVQFGHADDPDRVVVRGPKDEAERVARELERIADEAAKEEIVNSHVVEFEIETALVRHVVGKAGAGVNKLREDLGVRVDFVELATTTKKGAKLSKVTIKGRKENVEEAAKRVKSTANKMADEVTLTIPLPAALDRGSLIGKQGTYLKRLEEKYEVRINFPKGKAAVPDDVDERSSSSSSEIVIRGPSKGAQAAKGELVDLISYEKEHGNVASFVVPAKALARILGRGGAQVNQIKDDTGVASVDVDHRASDNPDATISLRGTKHAIKHARAEIEKIAREVEDEAKIEMDIPKEYHTTLIGSGGSSIRDLIARCGGPAEGRASGNMVRFPRQGDASTTVTIVAPQAIARKIHAALELDVASLKSRVVWGVVVAQSAHAAVIGKGASALQELQRKHGVKIFMPGWNDYAAAGPVENADDDDDEGVAAADAKEVVKVVGPKESVLAAAVDLRAVKGRGAPSSSTATSGTATPNGNGAVAGHSVRVDVPKRHHAVVAQGGRFFRSLPNGTRVSHEGVKPPSSTLKAKKPPATSSSRIDDAGEYDATDAALAGSDGIEFHLVSLHDGDDNDDAQDAETIPWVIESRNEDDAEKVADEIRKSLARADEATHVGWITVPRGMMPRIVGRGGSGLDRLRSTGVDVEVVGKRDANQLTLTGSPAAIEEARGIIEQLNAPRQRRDRDDYY
ncbi:hypothetical protein JCM11491_003456 [Sporobolomyces phaffii]